MTPHEIGMFEREVLYGLVVGDVVTVRGFTFRRLRTPGNHRLEVRRDGARRLDPSREYSIQEVMAATSDILYLLQQDAKMAARGAS